MRACWSAHQHLAPVSAVALLRIASLLPLLMSNDRLVDLFHSSSFLVLTHLPPTLIFSLSLNGHVWSLRCPSQSGVLGIKFIPPHGMHALSLGIKDSHFRVGFFWQSEHRCVLVLKYDAGAEDWHVVPQAHEWTDRLAMLDSLLVPYPRAEVASQRPEALAKDKAWHELTCWMTGQVLRRTLPMAGTCCTGVDLQSLLPVYKANSQTPSHYSEPGLKSKLPSPSASAWLGERDWIYFPVLHMKPSRSTPLPLTTQALDKSYLLDSLLAKARSEACFLGEWQLAFLLAVKCANMEGLDHWKTVFELLTHCRAALQHRCKTFIHSMTVLKAQLLEISRSDAEMLLGNQNFIEAYVNELLCAIDEQAQECDGDSALSQLAHASRELQASLQAHFGWPLSRDRAERDDERPVLVELDQQGSL